jgi:cephalosporin hydroxylase
MKRLEERFLTIDLEAGEVDLDHGRARYRLGTPEAFAAISRAWLRAGWDAKYVYSFTWLGRPIIQLPDDMVRLQEVIYSLRPEVILETGVAHGGSLVFSAGLCKLMDHGRVIGVDIEIRPHNRSAIEAHPLSHLITLFEGSSIEPGIVDQVTKSVGDADTVLVLLDSGHSRDHVLGELRAYGSLVSPGSYIVAMDGIMEQIAGAPRTSEDWSWNNPRQAVRDFLEEDDRFTLEEPPFLFNEGIVADRVTYWPGAFLKRRTG